MKYCGEFYPQMDKIAFACSEDMAMLASDPNAAAGGRPRKIFLFDSDSGYLSIIYLMPRVCLIMGSLYCAYSFIFDSRKKAVTV
jgi:hypothetical protein